MTYVLDTKKFKRYTFPTHINDVVLDRSDAVSSEIFAGEIEQEKAPPLHIHQNTEQIFSILEGEGILEIGQNDSLTHRTENVVPGNIVRIPPNIYQNIHGLGKNTLRYLAIDCFIRGKPNNQPTRVPHVKTLCKEQGWNYSKVKK